MGLAFTIQTCVQSPLKLDSGLLRISPFLRPTQFPKWDRFQQTHLLSIPFASVDCHYRRRHHSLIVCSRGTEQEEESSASEEEPSSSLSYDDVDNSKSSHGIKYVHDSEEMTKTKVADYVSSVRTVALWVCTAVAFGVGVGLKDGIGKASEFFAGYLLEQSLSVDNLFVFVLIFKYFKVPYMYQNRVLSYGIVGAIIFRLTVILLGTATLERFEAVNLLLAIVLLYSSFKLFAGGDEDSDLSDNFVVKTCQKFIPVTSHYDGNRFFTVQDGVWKASNILGRLPLYFSQ